MQKSKAVQEQTGTFLTAAAESVFPRSVSLPKIEYIP